MFSIDYKEVIFKVPILGFIVKWLAGNDADYGGLLALLSIGLMIFGLGFTDISRSQIFAITVALSPLWITYLIFNLFFSKWMDYVGKKFYLYNGRTTLRIRLPKEVTKSPEAMEFVMAQIHNTANPDNLMQTYLQGKRPLTYSFELVSIGGDVRFYVNVPTSKTKAAFEANMYAQYPGVEIIEEPVDYASEIPHDFENEWEVFSCHMNKKRNQEFPIKTYDEFGLNMFPEEEEKVDPITPMLEVLSIATPHQRIYVQFICISYRKDSFKNGQLVTKEGADWSQPINKTIDDLMKRDPEKKTSGPEDMREEIARLTPGERNFVETLEKHKSKYAYHTGIRWIYAAKKGKFNGDLINPIIRSFSQYDEVSRNQIGVKWRTDMGYKDFIPGANKKIDAWRKQELKEYKLRFYYNKVQADQMQIFTTDELATMFHLPGAVAMTPSLDRIGSTRGEAPNNLPTLPE